MKTYKILGGGTITADGNLDIIQKLNDSSIFGRRKDLSQFVKETAGACKMQTGAEIRTNSYEYFVEDLIKAGFLTEV